MQDVPLCRLPPAQGALLVKALGMAMDSADVIASEAKQSMEPIGARRADALSRVAEDYMNAEPVPNSTADRNHVVVQVSAETSVSHLHDGPGVSAETGLAAHYGRRERIGDHCERHWVCYFGFVRLVCSLILLRIHC